MKNDLAPDVYDYLTWLEQSPEAIKHALDAIAIYDLDGHVVYGNTAARVLIGAEYAGLLVGRHFTAHLTLEAATNAARDLQPALRLANRWIAIASSATVRANRCRCGRRTIHAVRTAVPFAVRKSPGFPVAA